MKSWVQVDCYQNYMQIHIFPIAIHDTESSSKIPVQNKSLHQTTSIKTFIRGMVQQSGKVNPGNRNLGNVLKFILFIEFRKCNAMETL
jgi:hypothetical protein